MRRLREFGATDLSLTVNFRNPKLVAHDAYSFARKSPPLCKRQLHSPVEYIAADGEKAQFRKLRAILVELIRDGVSPSDVAILSFKKNGDRIFDRTDLDIGKPLLSPAIAEREPNGFIASTVSGFKGLEAEVVILVDIPIELGDDWSRSIFAVALTRARTKAFVIGSSDILRDVVGKKRGEET